MNALDWNEVCLAYGPIVWSTVYRILDNHADALDCYQEVFLEAYRRTDCRAVDNWPALLKWLSARRAIDFLRRRKRENRLQSGDTAALCSAMAHPDQSDLTQRELMERLKSELTNLPDRQGEAFWLHSIEQLTYAEVAGQMGTDTSEVGVLIHRARKQLRVALSEFTASPIKETT